VGIPAGVPPRPAAVFGLMLVSTLLANFLPSDWQANVDRWLPLKVALVAGGVAVGERDAGPPDASEAEPSQVWAFVRAESPGADARRPDEPQLWP
jgi:hypothetical protein